ncbi:MAG: transcription antiterminator [Paenibacillus sp.]|uniref:Transcriptional antiterminator, BglG family n=1 Tax=Paenibacillus aquistagni TaxID=1852522 RepID=A0A1X7LEK6_9BACL|nr:transcription antiterminator [Paenibacillus aquistagni]MBR2568722.1 transcription antiterminator [Paenibacillus sp.]NMM52973.1 transcription antiterminator [Paenibacillus aquistagni]SMG51977.1 transcriptional antiterminator, BglG family [Paenibacillus aquistagni]
MSNERRLEIVRALSNNVVLTNDVVTNTETILMGKGIGFGVKPGTTIQADDSRIEKRFSLQNKQHMNQYQALIEQIDPEVITVSERIISMVSEQLTPDLNEHIHLALPSHIEFTLYRLRNQMPIENPFLLEIRTLNPDEFNVAIQASKLIERTFNVKVPEEETGFLTIHIQSAVAHVPVGNVVQHSHLLKDLVTLIESHRGMEIPKDSVDYVRLITHLRFAIERIRKGEHSRNPFRDKMKDMVPYEFGVAKQCGDLMAERLGVDISEDEVAYIAMHLYRLFSKDID